MFGMKFPLRFAWFCFLIIVLPLAAKDGTDFEIDDLSVVRSLDGSDWKVTSEDLDPEKIYQSVRNGENPFSDWEGYSVPGNYLKNRPDSNSKISRIWIAKPIRIGKKDKADQISIRLGIISDRDEAYWDGHRIGKSGDFGSEKPQAYDKVRIYEIPESLTESGSTHVLLVKVEKYFPNDIGITGDRVEIGPSDLIRAGFDREEYLKLLLLTIYFTVGVYFAFLFIRRRKESENLYFSAFTLLLVIYQFLRNQTKYDLGISFFVLKKTEYLVLIFTVPLFCHFLRTYFRAPRTKILHVLDALCFLSAIFILSTGDVKHYMFVNQNIVQPIWIGYVAFAFFWLYREIRKRNRDAILVLSGMGLVLAATVVDILTDRGVFVFPRLVGYSFVFFVLSLATILANKFVRLNEEVEELNGSLEKKIEERTLELNQTLDQMRKLKIQQDGDYFLTALLINPLAVNENKSPKVRTDFYIKQKKTFEFRSKNYEIGGDICVSGNLELRGRQYTVFLNGDAMGKSIQGAGGALVLGSVFRAILTRSKTAREKEASPEQWLKQVFTELQQVYESFDGSMYVSAVIGLLDDETGFLYYINAEHPWTILYRDGRASFIEDSLTCRKFGTPDNEKNLLVQTFELFPKDVIFIGSDGKDDLKMLGRSGDWFINEDTEQILSVVEDGEGHPEKIFQFLISKGELYDDFTLLRLEYTGEKDGSRPKVSREYYELFMNGKSLLKSGNRKEGLSLLEKAFESFPYDGNLLRLLGEQFLKERAFLKAASYLESYISRFPSSLEHFYYAAYGYKMSGEIQKATELCERLTLRNREHVKAQALLAEMR